MMPFAEPSSDAHVHHYEHGHEHHHEHGADCGDACCERPAKMAKHHHEATTVTRGLAEQKIARADTHDDGSCLVCNSFAEAAERLKSPAVASCIIPPSGDDAELAAAFKGEISNFPLFELETTLDVGRVADLSSALKAAFLPRVPVFLQDPARGDGELMRKALLRLERLICDVQAASAGAEGVGSKVRARVESVDGVLCPRFHQDHVPLRGCLVMAGETTDVLPESAVDRKTLESAPAGALLKTAPSTEEWNRLVAGGHSPEDLVQKAPVAGTLLMKGLKWKDADKSSSHLAAVHRSPPDCGRRLLLAVDVKLLQD